MKNKVTVFDGFISSNDRGIGGQANNSLTSDIMIHGEYEFIKQITTISNNMLPNKKDPKRMERSKSDHNLNLCFFVGLLQTFSMVFIFRLAESQRRV